jgi:hypothetical protein
MARARASFGSLLVIVLGLVVAGCGSLPAPTLRVKSLMATSSLDLGSTIVVPPPVDTAVYFLRAMGSGDVALMNTYLVPGRREGAWNELPPADEFQNVKCHAVAGYVTTATAAVVACDFDVRKEWGGFPAGAHPGWTVSLQRQPPGPWLVDNYGEG